jgi:mevalonate kinase
LAPGHADLTFLIPREIFNNNLNLFAKELAFINRLVEHFSEAVIGQTEPVTLDGLSSSMPAIGLGTSARVVASIADAVSKFLDAWEKIKKIRRLRSELSEVGIKKQALDELTEEVTTTIEEVVEESTRLTLIGFEGEPGRKHELETALKQDTRRLFGQIERGLTIQVNAGADDSAAPADKQALETVRRVGKVLQFPPVATEPILLTAGEVLEGELSALKTSKKTATRTTVTRKQTAQKDPD